MANKDKMEKAAQNVAETTRDPAQTVVDHTVGLQERNVQFTQSMVDSYIKELRQQAERNRAVLEEFATRAEKQRDAYQTLVSETVDAYMDFVYAPFSYYREGLQAVGKAAK